jgi:predicted HTH domain antitoxin
MSALKLDLPPEVTAEEARLLLAVKLYELQKLSLGQAAKLAGYSKRAFMEILGRHGVPVFAYSPEELREEAEA